MIKRCSLLALVLFALSAAPCFADIYAYVDDQGRSHFSDVQVDARYRLYMKTKAATVEKTPAGESTAEVVVADAEPAAAFERPVPLQARKRYNEMIAKVAKEQAVDPALLHAVVTVESAYNARAKSPKGATGLMQLMPDTGKRFGAKNLLNPLENLRAGARYLRSLLELFDNNMRLAIAAYNAGEGAVMRSGNAVPNYPETRAYVPRVMDLYQRFRAFQ